MLSYAVLGGEDYYTPFLYENILQSDVGEGTPALQHKVTAYTHSGYTSQQRALFT